MMPGRGMRLLVTVTFKPNQLRAHLEPILALDDVETVMLVSDELAPSMPKVSTVTPPRWLRRLLGRAGSKFVVCLRIARREGPDWIVAYHLLPHGITASTVGRLSKTKSLSTRSAVQWSGRGAAGTLTTACLPAAGVRTRRSRHSSCGSSAAARWS